MQTFHQKIENGEIFLTKLLLLLFMFKLLLIVVDERFYRFLMLSDIVKSKFINMDSSNKLRTKGEVRISMKLVKVRIKELAKDAIQAELDSLDELLLKTYSKNQQLDEDTELLFKTGEC